MLVEKKEEQENVEIEQTTDAPWWA